MTKRELIDRLQRAGDRTRALAASYVVEDLPPAILFTLQPDYGALPGNDLVPFRIRGPGVPEGWRSVELDGRVRLR